MGSQGIHIATAVPAALTALFTIASHTEAISDNAAPKATILVSDVALLRLVDARNYRHCHNAAAHILSFDGEAAPKLATQYGRSRQPSRAMLAE